MRAPDAGLVHLPSGGRREARTPGDVGVEQAVVVREPLVARVRPTSGRTAEEFPLLRRFLRVAMAMPEPDVLELEHARCEQD